MASTQTPSPEQLALRRAHNLPGLMWHAGAFVIISAFFWILNAMGPGGI